MKYYLDGSETYTVVDLKTNETIYPNAHIKTIKGIYDLSLKPLNFHNINFPFTFKSRNKTLVIDVVNFTDDNSELFSRKTYNRVKTPSCQKLPTGYRGFIHDSKTANRFYALTMPNQELALMTADMLAVIYNTEQPLNYPSKINYYQSMIEQYNGDIKEISMFIRPTKKAA